MEGGGGGLLSVFLVFSFLLAEGGESLSRSPKTNCTYSITVETTCTRGAETSSHISLRFGDSDANDVVIRHLNDKHTRRLEPLDPAVLDDTPRKPFQVCTVDEFRATGPCVASPVCYLYFKSVGEDEWRPGIARVVVVEDPKLSSQYFYFRRYLPRHVWHGSDLCRGETTRFGIRRKRKVFVKEP